MVGPFNTRKGFTIMYSLLEKEENSTLCVQHHISVVEGRRGSIQMNGGEEQQPKF